jgi:hypothetical protein
MLEFLRGNVSDRKGRLFGCGCCRRAWHLFDPGDRLAVELAERMSDGEAEPSEGERLRQRIGWRRKGAAKYTVTDRVDQAAQAIRINAVESLVEEAGAVALKRALGARGATQQDVWKAAEDASGQARTEASSTAQRHFADLLRCIHGSLQFRLVSIDPFWLTSTVLALATGIYADRAFDRLPILADALQDAGCNNEDILNHCRGPGPHVRGCWVIDLLLGRE